MPAIPMADSEPPIEVGISVTEQRGKVDDRDLGTRPDREHRQGGDDQQEHEAQPGQQNVQ